MTNETNNANQGSSLLRWQARFDGQAEADASLPPQPTLERDFSAIGGALRRDTAEALESLSFAGFEAALLAKLEEHPAKPALWRRVLLLAGAGTALCVALLGAFLVGQNQARDTLTQGPGVLVEGLALQNENKVKVFEAQGEAKQVTVIWLGETER